MALDTSIALRNQILYSVFVRQYSAEGTFDAVRRDVGRIRALGTDIVWLLPVYPLGEAKRKGTLGSPYAIRDYRAVNPEFGTLADFRALVDAIHAEGMKCMLDVVYNHTSPDSVLARTHPEWFYHRPDGSFGNKNGDWTDIIDLDYTHPALWDYQIETLKQWAALVDGFRCDAAPLVPLAFWLRARREVEAVRPGCLWLAESVEPAYIAANRAQGIPCLSDGELYGAFDVTYDYDIYYDFLHCLTGEDTLAHYAAALTRQETAYPENYVKLRCLENHDRPRLAALVPDARARRCWTAFLYFCKGLVMLYNGQEASAAVRPGLFDPDPVDWTGEDLSPMLRRLAQLRRDPLLAQGSFSVREAGRGVLLALYESAGRRAAGVFPVASAAGAVRVPLPDGRYENHVDGRAVRVENGLLCCAGEPAVIFC